MTMIRFLLMLIFAAVILWACDESEDPATAVGLPVIKVDFEARQSKDTTKALFDSLSARYVELGELLDSIAESDHPEDTVAILAELDQIGVQRDSVGDANDLFQKNQIRLDSYIAIGGAFFEEYQDTVNSIFNFPLNINSDSSAFAVKFHNFTDTIIFRYQKEVVSDIDRVFVIATNVSARNTNPNIELSRHICVEETCISSEITYKAYF